MQQVCSTCGSVVEPKKVFQGSLGLEIVLWLMCFPVGLLYSVWRLSSKKTVCTSCGAETLLPLDSPMGKKILDEMEEYD